MDIKPISKEHREIIQRRIDHLTDRIHNYKGKSSSYDRHELSALRTILHNYTHLFAEYVQLKQSINETVRQNETNT